jgi:hypothetical protein
VCIANWFVQFSLVLSDKICLNKLVEKSELTISPMNAITCLVYATEKFNCNSRSWFQEEAKIKEIWSLTSK